MRLLIFLKTTKSRSFLLCFRSAKVGLAYLLNGSVVMIPYLCNRASSTSISSLRLSGAGRLWLYTVLPSMGVTLTLKSFSMPYSNRCLAKMFLNWTDRFTMDVFVCETSVESVKSKFDRNTSREFWFARGLSLSNSSNAYNSVRTQFCVGM